MANHKSNSVLDLARRTSENSEVPKLLEAKIRRRQLVKKLMAIRAAKGLSQKDIADKMNCTQSKISKFESSNDDDLRLGDLSDYLSASGLGMQIVICEKKWKAMDAIKFHAFNIKQCLWQMTKHAESDAQIMEGVKDAHVETLVNLVKMVLDSAKNLRNADSESCLPRIVDATADERDMDDHDCDDCDDEFSAAPETVGA